MSMAMASFSGSLQSRPLSKPSVRRTSSQKPRGVKVSAKTLREEDSIQGAPGISVDDKGQVDSYECASILGVSMC